MHAATGPDGRESLDVLQLLHVDFFMEKVHMQHIACRTCDPILKHIPEFIEIVAVRAAAFMSTYSTMIHKLPLVTLVSTRV